MGDAAFREKSRDVFMARMQESGALFVSHQLPMVRELCDMGAVLEDGNLTLYEDVEEAIVQHKANMRSDKAPAS